jgi:hypothetical protein
MFSLLLKISLKSQDMVEPFLSSFFSMIHLYLEKTMLGKAIEG